MVTRGSGATDLIRSIFAVFVIITAHSPIDANSTGYALELIIAASTPGFIRGSWTVNDAIADARGLDAAQSLVTVHVTFSTDTVFCKAVMYDQAGSIKHIKVKLTAIEVVLICVIRAALQPIACELVRNASSHVASKGVWWTG
jgi:spore maturation protein SpmB